MDSVDANSFSTIFSTASHELSHNLILSVLQNIDTSTMSTGVTSELIDWLNYNSPISPMNIDQTLARITSPQQPNHPHYQYQYPPQPLSHSFIPATTYPPPQPSSSFMQPPFYVPQRFNNYPMQQFAYAPSPVAYHGPVWQPPFDMTPQQFNNGNIPTNYPMQQYAYAPSFVAASHGQVRYLDDTFITDFLDGTSEYEDMLQLQEQIGHVNVGLSEKTISSNLKTSRISAASGVKQEEEEAEGEVCAVCQDEYKINETIGALDCGHIYHANCIKQWLLQKNVCPICKSTALNI